MKKRQRVDNPEALGETINDKTRKSERGLLVFRTGVIR